MCDFFQIIHLFLIGTQKGHAFLFFSTWSQIFHWDTSGWMWNVPHKSWNISRWTLLLKKQQQNLLVMSQSTLFFGSLLDLFQHDMSHVRWSFSKKELFLWKTFCLKMQLYSCVVTLSLQHPLIQTSHNPESTLFQKFSFSIYWRNPHVCTRLAQLPRCKRVDDCWRNLSLR